MAENHKTPNPAVVAARLSPGVQIEAGPPHEALFFVLSYLPLFELLSMSAVCVSLRDVVKHDVLLWLQIVVDWPLNYRLSDEILGRIARKADGRLRTLALIKCPKISDSGLQEVVEKNPLLTKLYVPACTSLTPGGVVRAVITLSQHSHNLNTLMIGGIYRLKKSEHLEVLKYHLLINRSQQLQQKPQQQQQRQQYLLYHKHSDPSKWLSNEYQPMIDVEICPKCHDIRRVYDCSRERCKIKQDCRACNNCIPRCEECGGCTNDGDDEIEYAICSDVLCLSCWLQLPKCKHCNMPYCKRHRDNATSSGGGFVCENCVYSNLMVASELELKQEIKF